MKSITFEEVTNKIAENQEQYNTVHSQWNPEEQSVNMCFDLEFEEIQEIKKTGVIWYKQLIGSGHMHPMRISAFKEDMIFERKEIKDLNDIDTKSPEGKMFMAAIAMITTELYQDITPGDVIELVGALKNKMKFQ